MTPGRTGKRQARGPGSRLTGLLTSAYLLLASFATTAATIEADNLQIHYTLVPSSSIPVAVADLHKLSRGRHRFFLNLTMQHAGLPTTGIVKGEVASLLHQARALEFMEITEPPATYYLAQISASPGERLRFQISVQPPGRAQPIELDFSESIP